MCRGGGAPGWRGLCTLHRREAAPLQDVSLLHYLRDGVMEKHLPAWAFYGPSSLVRARSRRCTTRRGVRPLRAGYGEWKTAAAGASRGRRRALEQALAAEPLRNAVRRAERWQGTVRGT
jgi:hypothetical protein